MQHTVIAFFDTYAAAETAREALVANGIARESVALQARCEPTYVTDATTVVEPPVCDQGLLASIERFFESLFASTPAQPETRQYAEAVRRGAVMLSVDAASDEACESARATLATMHPIDIEERAATWTAPSDATIRERSPLEELGISRGGRASTQGPVRSYARDTDSSPAPDARAPREMMTDEAAAMAVAAGSAPGMGAVLAAGYGKAQRSGATPAASDAPAASAASTGSPASVPDEYLQEEEHFRGEGEGEGSDAGEHR